VLIPSIDLMGGKIVQLVQGKEKALEFEEFDEWIERFSNYPLVQLIDLDAAIGSGDNRRIVRRFTSRLHCQVGGGVRSAAAAEALLAIGAERVIIGSSLIRDGKADATFAATLAGTVGNGRLVFAVDSRHGRVAIRGWREVTDITPQSLMQALEPWCSAFLYTHVDAEGLMEGLPVEAVLPLRQITQKQFIVAGGITTTDEIERLDRLGIDAVVGMAIYTGRMKV